YFDGLTRWYFDTQGTGWGTNTTWNFTDFWFRRVENEPDDIVTSVCAQYTGSRYDLTWSGPKNVTITYEVRYSPTEFTSFSGGTSGGTTQNEGSTYLATEWLSPAMAESTTGMYFVIRQQGGDGRYRQVHVPYQMGPGNIG